MVITITRGKSTPEGTPGVLTTDDGFTCDTLELEWQNNLPNVSCILADTYSAFLWFSPHLQQQVVRLQDKHGRANCLMHNANFAGEGTDEIKQIEGCTALGDGYGDIMKPDNSGTQWGILKSEATLKALVAHINAAIGANPFNVTYVWGDGCAPDDLTDKNPADQ